MIFGQLLQDNQIYQKLLQELWKKKKKREYKHPLLVVNFLVLEDYKGLEFTINIDSYLITYVSMDRGLGVNIILEKI